MSITLEQLTTSDYVAAIPGLVYHYPQDVLCLIFSRRGRIDMVITPRIDQDQHAAAAYIARVAQAHDIDDARIIVIAHPAQAAKGIRFADIARDQLEARDIPVRLRAHTWHIRRGAMWTDLDDADGGTIPDPTTTDAAVAALAAGHLILGARADIAAHYTLEPTPDFTTRREAIVHSHQRGFATRTLRDLAALIDDNGYPSPALAARVSIMAVIYPDARDALLGLGLIDLDAAAAIYVEIANQLRGLARAHLLAAAAALYYVAGQGMASYEAITHAQTCARNARAEDSSIINLVVTAHARAFRPELIRRFLAVGQVAAAKFGIRVPDYAG